MPGASVMSDKEQYDYDDLDRYCSVLWDNNVNYVLVINFSKFQLFCFLMRVISFTKFLLFFVRINGYDEDELHGNATDLFRHSCLLNRTDRIITCTMFAEAASSVLFCTDRRGIQRA